MKVKVVRLGEHEYLVVVSRSYMNSAKSIDDIAKAMKVTTPATWHIRTKDFLKEAIVVDV